VAGDQSGLGAAREALPQDLETFLMEDNKVTNTAFKITPNAPYVGNTVPFSYGHLRPDVSSVLNNSNYSSSNRNLLVLVRYTQAYTAQQVGTVLFCKIPPF
jgi:hypothetical protein